MVDWTLVIWFGLGIITGTAIWNIAMNTAKTIEQAMVLSIGFYKIQLLAISSVLWLFVMGVDLWGFTKYIATYFLGTTIHPRLQKQRNIVDG